MSDDDDYDPYLHRTVEKPITDTEAFISLLKCSLGSGCLAMPMAFQLAGWATGFLSAIIMGTIVIYAFHLLIRGMYEMCKRVRVSQLTFPEAMKLALHDGPPFLRIFAEPTGVFVDLFLSLYHFGVCSVYVVFIADNIKQVMDYYIFEMDSRLYMCLLAVPLIAIYLIRNMKALVPFSAVSNVMLLIGLVAVMFYLLRDLPPLAERVAVQGAANFPIYYGSVLFSLESVGVMIAIEANMKTPQHYLGLRGILVPSLGTVLFLYTIMGFFGYWRYGDDVQPSITLNLPATDIASQFIKIIFALSIYFSYPLQGYVTIDIVWNNYLAQTVHRDKRLMMEYAVRTAIVVASVICAIIFPDLGLFLALVGSFCLSFLGLIFPALLDLCVKYKIGYGLLKIFLVQDILLMLFGTVGGATGTWVSLKAIIQQYKEGSY